MEASGDIEMQEHLKRSRARAAMGAEDSDEAGRPSGFVKLEDVPEARASESLTGAAASSGHHKT
eukprot:3470538-Amphidinium_carterae.1